MLRDRIASIKFGCAALVMELAAAQTLLAQSYGPPAIPQAPPAARPSAYSMQTRGSYAAPPAGQQQFAVPPAGQPAMQQQLSAQPQAPYAAQPPAAYAASPQGQSPYSSQSPAQFAAPTPGQYSPSGAVNAGGFGQPSYPPTQVQPAGGPPQQYAAPGTPTADPNAAGAYGQTRPGEPVRVAQQPGAAAQTVAAGANDAALSPMNALAPGADPTAVNPSALPVELQPHASAAAEHPLAPAIRWASSEIANIRAIRDYSCFFYKRERIDGQLGGYQAMYCKVRHEPLSVYLYFKSPSNLEGQEVIWVKGLNDGNLQAHTTGIKSVVGTVSLSPTGAMAMKGNRYPITETGILNLLERLVAVGTKDMQYGECDVQFFTSAQGVKVGGRPCTCIQVTHPVPRRNFLFHQARIYVDEELRLPIRYESYDWPTQPGGQPLLMEEYTYQNLKINNGFTDIDFDVRNPNYGFK